MSAAQFLSDEIQAAEIPVIEGDLVGQFMPADRG